MSQENQKNMEQYIFRASAADFKKIPGSPIAYWVSSQVGSAFQEKKPIERYFPVIPGIRTGKDELFLRLWFEVSRNDTQFGLSGSEQMMPSTKWFPLHKGGSFRKWYGNAEHVIDLLGGGENIKTKSPDFRLREDKWYFKSYISWSRISSSDIAFRYFPNGVLFSDAGPGIFAENKCLEVISLLNSKLGNFFLRIINPTMNYQKQDVEAVPYLSLEVSSNISDAVSYGKGDWDAYETSWDFTGLPLLKPDHSQSTLSATYQHLRAHWREVTLEMQRIEEENNCTFIEAYGLQDDLTPEVPLKEITLTCNPHYRYGGDKSEGELESQLQSDTMAEFLGYAVGCMFGRYSLDKSGLVLANQGDTLAEYLRQIPESRFMPDEDNVIPLLDGEWFADDVTERFRTFLRVTFGEAHYEANLAFIEQSLGKDVRKYFLKDFYTDHVKRYKKRPIYWLFASPKGTFSALIYLHRYRPDTVSVVLQYLRDFRKKLAARLDYLQQVGISTSASQGEKTRALKEIETLKKQLLELDDYERDTLYPLATEQVALDLDDGVKVNYLKLGSALKKIIGLDAKED